MNHNLSKRSLLFCITIIVVIAFMTSACTGATSSTTVATPIGTTIPVGSTLSTDVTTQPTGDTTQPTDDSSQDGTTDLGTIIGNPNAGKASLFLKTISTDGETSLYSMITSDNCTPYVFDGLPLDFEAQTQECLLTPSRYRIGVTAIYLVRCVDESGADVTCSAGGDFSVAERVAVYNGEMTDLDIDDIGSAVDLSLANLDSAKTFGGIQIVTSYISQDMPSADSEYADMITPSLRGKSFLICTTPAKAASSSELTEECGYDDARRGDFLIDTDGDNLYGYIDLKTIAPDHVEETQTRPSLQSGYIFIVKLIAKGLASFTGHPEEEFTNGATFGDVAGYYAPILSFESLATVAPDNGYTFTATIDIRDTFSFRDGARNPTIKNTCVAALAPDNSCPLGDDDPESVGVYDPYYDGIIAIESPVTNVTVTEGE